MKKAFRKSLKRQASLGYFGTATNGSISRQNRRVASGCQTPIFWQNLSKKYRFNNPRDWYRIEAHWLDQIESFQEQPVDCPGRDGKMNNSITRISQCNESYQLCNSLPRSFIVPKDLKDFTLMNSMSTVIKDHRVPVISYCCPIEYRRNFIIRCASSDQQTRVVDILNKVVKPLKVFNLTSMAPTLEKVESAHKKLCDACRPGEDCGASFFARTGKWLNIVSIALKLMNETAKTLLTEASVILFEDDDRGWNSVVSSLIQLVLEPHCRTVEGYESLISKEWIYLAGGTTNYTKPDVLFTLLLDCTYQIYIQNPTKFEFTSEYLRFLFEAQYVCPFPSTIADSELINDVGQDSSSRKTRNNGTITKSKTNPYTIDEEEDKLESGPTSYRLSSINPNEFNLSTTDFDKEGNASHDITSGYKLYMFNPFFAPDPNSPILEVYDHVVNIKLWSSLYLSWLTTTSYGCAEESLYFQIYPPKLNDLSKNT